MTKQETIQDQDMTPVHKNVHVALVAAQSEMGPLVKGSNNPHFKSKYADLSDLVQAVRGPFNRNGLAYYHQIVRGDGFEDMRTVIVHGETGTEIFCDVPLIVQKQDMQGMKSATTYAKRIGLESVSGIAPEDDDGNAAAKAAPTTATAPRDPWLSTILGELPDNATDRDRAMAVAQALCAQFKRMKGVRQIGNEWDRRVHLIEGEKGLEKRHPDLHETVVDAYENRLNEIKEKEAA